MIQFQSVTPILNTHNIAETIQFYTEVLGFTLHNNHTASERSECTLFKNDQRVCFKKSSSVNDLTLSGRLHFSVQNLAETWEKIKDKSDPVYPPQDLQDGNREFAIQDNNGYILSFAAEPKPVNPYDRFFPPTFQLETPRVILRMMNESDAEALSSLTTSEETWAYFTRQLSDKPAMSEWVNEAIDECKNRKRVPFVVIDKHGNELCGCTSFGNISFADKRIEIGWSWLKDEARGTGLNKAAKFALLSYAFEVMQMERVEIKTDNLNERSKAALLKVGMIPEGVLRSHMQMHSDRRRDTIYFSILKQEWRERKQQFFGEFL